MTQRQLTNRLVIMLPIVIPITLCFMGIMVKRDFDYNGILVIASLLTLTELTIFAIVVIIICLSCGIKTFVERFMIKNRLDNSFYSIGAYVDTKNDGIVRTPRVYFKKNRIVIVLENIDIRSKIEAKIDILSTALPDNLIVRRTYINNAGDYIVVEYSDLRKDKRMVFNSIEEVEDYTNRYSYEELFIDQNTFINLADNTSMLITGISGKGKSYATQFLITQGIIKNYEISVLDIKRSYQAYEDYVTFVSEPYDIIHELQNVSTELKKRKLAMDEPLKQDPKALASNYGFPIKLVVIEEFIALMNCGISSTEQKLITSLIKEITTSGRSLDVHLIMVMQVSGYDTLDSAIKANLPVKLVFGEVNETVYKTAFGLSNAPKTRYLFDKGEGIGLIEGNNFLFRIPTLNYKISELKRYKTSFVG